MSRAPSPITQLLPAPAAQTAGYDAITDFAKAGFQLQQVAKETKRKTDYNNFLAQMTEWDAEARVASNQAGTDQIQSTYANTMRSRYEGYLNNNQEILQDSRYSRLVTEAYTTASAEGNANRTAVYAKKLGVDQYSSLLKIQSAYLVEIADSDTPMFELDIDKRTLEVRKALTNGIGTSNNYVNNLDDVDRITLEFRVKAERAAQKGIAAHYSNSFNENVIGLKNTVLDNMGDAEAINSGLAASIARSDNDWDSKVAQNLISLEEAEEGKRNTARSLAIEAAKTLTSSDPTEAAALFNDPNYLKDIKGIDTALRSELEAMASKAAYANPQTAAQFRTAAEARANIDELPSTSRLIKNPIDSAQGPVVADMNDVSQAIAAFDAERQKLRAQFDNKLLSSEDYRSLSNYLTKREIQHVEVAAMGKLNLYRREGAKSGVDIVGLHDDLKAAEKKYGTIMPGTDPYREFYLRKIALLVEQAESADSVKNLSSRFVNSVITGKPFPPDQITPEVLNGSYKKFKNLPNAKFTLSGYIDLYAQTGNGDLPSDLIKDISELATPPKGSAKDLGGWVAAVEKIRFYNSAIADSQVNTGPKRLLLTLLRPHLSKYKGSGGFPFDADAMMSDLGDPSNPMNEHISRFNNMTYEETAILGSDLIEGGEQAQKNAAGRRETVRDYIVGRESIVNELQAMKDDPIYGGKGYRRHTAQIFGGQKAGPKDDIVVLNDDQVNDISRLASYYAAVNHDFMQEGISDLEVKKRYEKGLDDAAAHLSQLYMWVNMPDPSSEQRVRLADRFNMGTGVTLEKIVDGVRESTIAHMDDVRGGGLWMSLRTGKTEIRPDRAFDGRMNEKVIPVLGLTGDGTGGQKISGFHVVNLVTGENNYYSPDGIYKSESVHDDKTKNDLVNHRKGMFNSYLELWHGTGTIDGADVNNMRMLPAESRFLRKPDFPSFADQLKETDENVAQKDSRNYIFESATLALANRYGGVIPQIMEGVDDKGARFADPDANELWWNLLDQVSRSLGYNGWHSSRQDDSGGGR